MQVVINNYNIIIILLLFLVRHVLSPGQNWFVVVSQSLKQFYFINVMWLISLRGEHCLVTEHENRKIYETSKQRSFHEQFPEALKEVQLLRELALWEYQCFQVQLERSATPTLGQKISVYECVTNKIISSWLFPSL